MGPRLGNTAAPALSIRMVPDSSGSRQIFHRMQSPGPRLLEATGALRGPFDSDCESDAWDRCEENGRNEFANPGHRKISPACPASMLATEGVAAIDASQFAGVGNRDFNGETSRSLGATEAARPSAVGQLADSPDDYGRTNNYPAQGQSNSYAWRGPTASRVCIR